MAPSQAEAIKRLTDAVANGKTVDDSVIDLLARLSGLIRDNANDPAALIALADSLDAEQARVAAAVVENTPAAPTE